MSLPKEIISVGLKMENYLPFNFPIRSTFQSEGTTEYSGKSNNQSLTANFEVSRYAKAWRGVHVCPSRVVNGDGNLHLRRMVLIMKRGD